MRFDSSVIYTVRDPNGDESLRGAVKIAAFSDSSLIVNTLVQCIGLPEAETRLISPDADLAAHFKKHRPDIIFMNISMLGEDFLAELTVLLQNLYSGTKLPHLITVGNVSPPDRFRVLTHYPSCYNVMLPTQPFIEGETIRRHIIHEIIGAEFYRSKLRRSAELTMISLHADRYKSGFELLLDEVMIVLENSYVNIGTALNMHKYVASIRGITPSAVDLAVRPLIKDAIGKMSDSEYMTCFTEYISRGIRPSELEFVYACAKITSLTNKTVLDRLRDQTFHKPYLQ